MSAQAKALRNVLLPYTQRWEADRQQFRRVAYLEALVKKWEPTSNRSFQYQFSRPLRMGVGELFLYLPRVKSTLQPVVTVQCDFSKDPPAASLFLALFKDEHTAFSYRFETPEGFEDEDPELDVHEYHHVQHTPAVRGLVPPFPTPEIWPDSYPAPPVDAADPPSLAACMIVSLYGIGDLRRTVREHPSIRPTISAMRSLQRDEDE